MKRSFIKTFASFFALLGIIFIPFPFNITRVQLHITDAVFGKAIGFIAQHIFSKPLTNTQVYSDSISMYILLLLLFVLAVVISLALAFSKKWAEYHQKIYSILYRCFLYYLALQLLKYGADKLFKNQFYLPEPNTLFTPIGKADKDLLYWSTMGTSYSYNVFLGIIEILAAVLMLVKRTRLIGLLISIGVLLNVVAINFGFDISVKIFSSFLLLLNIYLLAPYGNRLYRLLVLKNNNDLPVVETHPLFPKTFLAIFLQWLAVCLIALEVFYPFLRTGHLNGDAAEKPYLHGAYEVTAVIEGTDTLPAVFSPVKRFFIHRDSYMIFQDQKDDMKDYKLALDKARSVFLLTDYQLHQTTVPFSYNPSDSLLILDHTIDGKEGKLVGKAINWRQLPAVNNSFHWTMDGGQ
ncbi:hypothetical protein [Ferruginibacter sp.]